MLFRLNVFSLPTSHFPSHFPCPVATNTRPTGTRSPWYRPAPQPPHVRCGHTTAVAAQGELLSKRSVYSCGSRPAPGAFWPQRKCVGSHHTAAKQSIPKPKHHHPHTHTPSALPLPFPGTPAARLPLPQPPLPATMVAAAQFFCGLGGVPSHMVCSFLGRLYTSANASLVDSGRLPVFNDTTQQFFDKTAVEAAYQSEFQSEFDSTLGGIVCTAALAAAIYFAVKDKQGVCCPTLPRPMAIDAKPACGSGSRVDPSLFLANMDLVDLQPAHRPVGPQSHVPHVARAKPPICAPATCHLTPATLTSCIHDPRAPSVRGQGQHAFRLLRIAPRRPITCRAARARQIAPSLTPSPIRTAPHTLAVAAGRASDTAGARRVGPAQAEPPDRAGTHRVHRHGAAHLHRAGL